MNYSEYDCLAIGIPKSGTNAMEKAIRLYGKRPSLHTHTANYHLAEKYKVGYIYRNPRNVLISAQRYQNHQVRGQADTLTEEKLITMAFGFFNAPIWAVYRGYEKWMTSQACLIRYEDLVSGAENRKLAQYLGVEEKPIHLELPGNTPTWTGKTSNWRDYWTEGLDKIWIEEGMLEIEESLGYCNV